MIDGRKYMTKPKPKNGIKIRAERVITDLLSYSIALPELSCSAVATISKSRESCYANLRYANSVIGVPVGAI
jgi:hypothetical protein